MGILQLLVFLLLVKTWESNARPQHQEPFPHRGVKFANTTVYGAMIMTDPAIAAVLGRDFHRVPQGVNGTAANNAEWRQANGKQTASEMPFHVELWLGLHGPECPNRKSKGNDRGVALSHFQIWHDFVTQGERHPGLVSAQDIMVIFEDDAVVTVTNIHEAMQSELSSMTTDILFLGWCYGRRYMPMCLHAYAITRAAASRLVRHFDMCYPQAIDAQLRHLAEQKALFTWRKAIPDSYKHLKPGFEDNPNYFTRGLFVQRKGLVSFNHHGFQNNAGRR